MICTLLIILLLRSSSSEVITQLRSLASLGGHCGW